MYTAGLNYHTDRWFATLTRIFKITQNKAKTDSGTQATSPFLCFILLCINSASYSSIVHICVIKKKYDYATYSKEVQILHNWKKANWSSLGGSKTMMERYNFQEFSCLEGTQADIIGLTKANIPWQKDNLSYFSCS